MKSEAEYTTNNVVAKYRAVLVELTEEREEWLRTQQKPIDQSLLSEQQKHHNTVLLKAMDKVILQIASYIDEIST